MAPNAGVCSRMRTRRPAWPKASAVVSPPRPPPTMMIGGSAKPTFSPPLHADPLDLPFKLDAGRFPNARAHRLAELLNLCGAGAAAVDEEVAMQLRHLGGPNRQAAAPRGVDELPSLVTGWILEGRAAGPALDGLGRLAAFGDFIHLGGDDRRIARRPLEQRLREDHVLGHAAVAVAVAHFAVVEGAGAAAAINAARGDQNVLGLAAVGAAIHPQCAADRARNAAQKRQPGNCGILGGPRHFHVRHRGAGPDTHALLGRDVAETPAETNHHARNTAIADDKIGA